MSRVTSLRSWNRRNGMLAQPRGFKLVVKTADDARSLKTEDMSKRMKLNREVGFRRSVM